MTAIAVFAGLLLAYVLARYFANVRRENAQILPPVYHKTTRDWEPIRWHKGRRG